MMLESVVSSVAEALRETGLNAVMAYPRQALCAKGETLVCVSVLRARELPAGLGAYLGMGTDPVTGLSEELYGSRCELEIALDIYLPVNVQDASAECMRAAELIARAAQALPEGIKISSLSLGQMSADAETGRFLCRGVMAASAYFIARAGAEDGEFTDFYLRGSVKI